MITIDPAQTSETDNYKLMIGTIIPRPIAFITTLSENGTVNAAPFSYFNVVSAAPPLISVAVQRHRGKMKDTSRNILRKKEFLIHIVDAGNLSQVNETAASLPPGKSEVDLADLTLIKSDVVSVPGIMESKVRMEVTLEKVISFGTEQGTTVDLIIGRIVRFHIDEKIYEDGRIDPQGLQAMSRLAGISYACIGQIISLERPL